MGHTYPGVNKVWPVADIRDCTYMSDGGHVMMIWAESLPRARGLQCSVDGRWEEEVTLVQNETKWMHLWLDYHRNIWEGREKESEQEGLKGHACYAWKQVWMWERMANEAMDVYNRVLMNTNGS